MLAVPTRIVTDMPWPLWLLIAVLSGPFALSLIFLLLGHGLPDIGAYWFSILVSTVSAVLYRGLLRKQVGSEQGKLQPTPGDTAGSFNPPDGNRRSVRRRPWVWLITVACLLPAGLFAYFFARVVQHSVRIQKEMTWECAPDQYKAWAPEAQPVRFRFVEGPQYEEVVSGRGLCDQLKATGKEPVMVEFEAWGTRQRGLIGYREIAVDGNPIIDAGGWGSSGSTGNPTGAHPLRRYFEELLTLGTIVISEVRYQSHQKALGKLMTEAGT